MTETWLVRVYGALYYQRCGVCNKRKSQNITNILHTVVVSNIFYFHTFLRIDLLSSTWSDGLAWCPMDPIRSGSGRMTKCCLFYKSRTCCTWPGWPFTPRPFTLVRMNFGLYCWLRSLGSAASIQRSIGCMNSYKVVQISQDCMILKLTG